MGGTYTPEQVAAGIVRLQQIWTGNGFSYEREVVWADLPHVLYRRYSPGSR